MICAFIHVSESLTKLLGVRFAFIKISPRNPY